jgi:hypothetical protein
MRFDEGAFCEVPLLLDVDVEEEEAEEEVKYDRS